MLIHSPQLFTKLPLALVLGCCKVGEPGPERPSFLSLYRYTPATINLSSLKLTLVELIEIENFCGQIPTSFFCLSIDNIEQFKLSMHYFTSQSKHSKLCTMAFDTDDYIILW